MLRDILLSYNRNMLENLMTPIDVKEKISKSTPSLPYMPSPDPRATGTSSTSWIHVPEYVGYPGGKVLLLVEPPSETMFERSDRMFQNILLSYEGTGEDKTVYVRYKRYSDGAIFWIPVFLESGAIYTQAIKTVKLSHGEIWSPIGLPNEILVSVVERYLAEHKGEVQEEQPPTQPPVGGNDEEKDNTWLWILGIVVVIVVIFLLKKR